MGKKNTTVKGYRNFIEVLNLNNRLIEILKKNDVILLCRNSSNGKTRTSRFSALFRNNSRFWEIPNWEFHISDEHFSELEKILEKEEALIKGEITQVTIKDRSKETTPSSNEPDSNETLGEQYEEVGNMTLDERRDRISHSIDNLDEALKRSRISSHEIASIMTDAAIYSTLINKVSIEEMSEENDNLAQRSLIQITEKSERLMTSFIEALSKNYNLNHTADAITGQTEGVTSRHMVRVFILSIRFLDYIKHQFEFTGLYRRLQSRFKSYYPLYEPLQKRYDFSNFNSSSLMPTPPSFAGKKLEEVMLGILLHDLGKKKNLLYFDGREGYDRKIIEGHAFDGYFMLMKKTVYQHSIASVAGMHHEYYGHEKGYGIFRDNYAEFKNKSHNKTHKFDYVLTNDYNDIINFKAVAYLPAKVLEIVDVYDAMIDSERQYKKAMSPVEALTFMRKEMIVGNLELDPILFDLFIKFLNQAKLI
jgi:hypothetical protein